MSDTRVSLPTRPFGTTERPDAWWLQPLALLLGLLAFAVYSTCVA